LHSQRPGGLDGAVLGPAAFVLRFFAENGHDRLLLVNLGRDLHVDPAPEPLLAPPEHMRWKTLWSSEDPRYGGSGTPPLESEDNWRIPGEAAVVLTPTPQEEMSHA
jgi:maltooligosyltrehalose trehalohydrolase